jgi:hypothetical protein
MSKDMYNDYLIWFKDHFGFHPTDNEFVNVDPINELIETRKDIGYTLNNNTKGWNRSDIENMYKKLNRLKIITFDEYKVNYYI